MSEPVKDTEETQHADDNSQGKRNAKGVDNRNKNY